MWPDLRKEGTSSITWSFSLFNSPWFQGSESPRLQTLLVVWAFYCTDKLETGNGRGSEFAMNVAGWLKNIHARFQVHSYYGSRGIISVLKQICRYGHVMRKCSFLKFGHIILRIPCLESLRILPPPIPWPCPQGWSQGSCCSNCWCLSQERSHNHQLSCHSPWGS